MEKQLKIISNFSFNYKDWADVCKWAKENGIRTFAELEMYCRIHKVKNVIDLKIKLLEDRLQMLYEKGKNLFKE